MKKNINIKKSLELFASVLLLLVSAILFTYIIAYISKEIQMKKLDKSVFNYNKNLLVYTSLLFIITTVCSTFNFLILRLIDFKSKKWKKGLTITNLVLLGVNLVYLIFILSYIPVKRNEPITALAFASLSFNVAILVISVINLDVLKKNKVVLTTKTLVEISAMVALSIILSLLADLIIPKFPPGVGRASLTMLPILLLAFRRGAIPAMIAGFTYSLFNMLIDGYIVHVGSIFLDYILSFTLVGLAGVFKFLVEKNNKMSYLYLTIAVIYSVSLRYLLTSISGVVYFGQYAPEGMNKDFYSFVVVNMPVIYTGGIASLLVLFGLKKHFINKETKVI